MKAIIKEVGKQPKVEEIKNDLETLQNLVGGYIELVRMGGGVGLIVNEEGKLNGLPVNFPIGIDFVVGTAVFVAYGNDGEFTDLSEVQEQMVMNFLE